MKITYQKPFEDLKIPNSEESELWDIYVSKSCSAFIYDGTMWLVLFDANLENSVSEDILFLISKGNGLYKEILDDLSFLDIPKYKLLNKENFVYRSFRKNIQNIWKTYEQRTVSSND